MTEDEADAKAAELCGEFQKLGRASFVIRTLPDGNLRIIGLELPPSTVVRMLRNAADIYEANGPADPRVN